MKSEFLLINSRQIIVFGLHTTMAAPMDVCIAHFKQSPKSNVKYNCLHVVKIMFVVIK